MDDAVQSPFYPINKIGTLTFIETDLLQEDYVRQQSSFQRWPSISYNPLYFPVPALASA